MSLPLRMMTFNVPTNSKVPFSHLLIDDIE